jgi:AcrR family transcriptional regulator
MSGNTDTKPSRAAPTVATPRAASPTKPDRRILRTRDVLGDALIALMHEQPFDSITVQQVLDRAGVSRATFYTHYRDKDDLLFSDVEDFFETMGAFLTHRGAPVARIFPVEEFFSHLAEMRDLNAAINASGKGPDVRELGIGCFARAMEQRLVLAGVNLAAPELRATGHALAGALFSLLDWWLGQGKRMPPKEVDALFHRMAWRGIAGKP